MFKNMDDMLNAGFFFFRTSLLEFQSTDTLF